MVSVLIVVIALVALAQFSSIYCHFLLLSYSRVKLSEEIQQLIQTEDRARRGEAQGDFKRLLQLARLCPLPGGSQVQIRVVRAYYFILKLLNAASRSWVPSVARWACHELARCSYFAAVTLDQRVSFTRGLLEEMNRGQR